MTKAYRYRAFVADNRSVTIENLPVEPGVKVDILVLVDEPAEGDQPRYPVRGLSVELDRPTDPVAGSDWAANRRM